MNNPYNNQQQRQQYGMNLNRTMGHSQNIPNQQYHQQQQQQQQPQQQQQGVYNPYQQQQRQQYRHPNQTQQQSSTMVQMNRPETNQSTYPRYSTQQQPPPQQLSQSMHQPHQPAIQQLSQSMQQQPTAAGRQQASFHNPYTQQMSHVYQQPTTTTINQQRPVLSQTQHQPSGRSVVPQQHDPNQQQPQQPQQPQVQVQQPPVQHHQAQVQPETHQPPKPTQPKTIYDELNNENPENYLDNHYRNASKPNEEDESIKANLIRFHRAEFIFAACMHNFNKYDNYKREAIGKMWKITPEEMMMTVKDPNNNDVQFTLNQKLYQIQEDQVKYLSDSMTPIRETQGMKLYYNAYFQLQKIQIDIISQIMKRSNATLDTYIEWIETILQMESNPPCPLSQYGTSYIKELVLYVAYALISMADPLTMIKQGSEHHFTNRVRILSIVLDLMIEYKAFDYMLPAFNLTPQDIVYGKFMQKSFEVYESGRVNEKHFFDLLHQCPFHDIQPEEKNEDPLIAFQEDDDNEKGNEAYTLPWDVIKTNIMDVCIQKIERFANVDEKRKLVLWCLKVIFTLTKHYPEHLMEIYNRLSNLPWPITKLLELVIPCGDWQHLKHDNDYYRVVQGLFKLYNENFSGMSSEKKATHQLDYVNNYLCHNIGILQKCYQLDGTLAAYHQQATFPVLNSFKAIAIGYATAHDWFDNIQNVESQNIFQEVIHILLSLAYKSGSTDQHQLKNLLDLRMESIKTIISLATFAPSVGIPIVIQELLILVPFLLSNQPNICSGLMEKLVKKLPFSEWVLTGDSFESFTNLFQENNPLFFHSMASYILKSIDWKNQPSSIKLKAIHVFLKRMPINEFCKLLCSQNGAALLDIDDQSATNFIKTSMMDYDEHSQQAQILALINFAIGLSIADAGISTTTVEKKKTNADNLLFFDDAEQPFVNAYQDKLQTWRDVANEMNYTHIANFMPSEMAGFVRNLVDRFISILSNFQMDDIGEELQTLQGLYNMVILKDEHILNTMLDGLASSNTQASVQAIYLYLILHDQLNEKVLDKLVYKLVRQNRPLFSLADKLKEHHKIGREHIHKWYSQEYYWLAYLGMLALEHQIPPLEHSGNYSSQQAVISLEADCCLWVAIHTAMNALNGYEEKKTLYAFLYFQLFFNKLYECMSRYGSAIFPEYQQRQYLKVIHQAQDHFANSKEDVASVFVCMDFRNPSTFFQFGDPLFEKLLEKSPYAIVEKKTIEEEAHEDEDEESVVYPPLITLPEKSDFEVTQKRYGSSSRVQQSVPTFSNLSLDEATKKRRETQQNIRTMQHQLEDLQGQLDALKTAIDLDHSQGMQTLPEYTQQFQHIEHQIQGLNQQLGTARQSESQLAQVIQQGQQKPPSTTPKKKTPKKPQEYASPLLSIRPYDALSEVKDEERILPQPLTIPFSVLQHDIQLYQRIQQLSNNVIVGGQQDLGALIIKEFDEHREVYKKWVTLDEDIFYQLQTLVDEVKDTHLTEIYSPYTSRNFKLQVTVRHSTCSPTILKQIQEYEHQCVTIRKQLHHHFASFAVFTSVLSTVTKSQLQTMDTSPGGQRCYFTLLKFLLNCPKFTLLEHIMSELYRNVGQLGKLVISKNPKFQRQILKILLSVQLSDESILEERQELFESFNPAALLSVDITKFREAMEQRRQSQQEFGMAVSNEEDPSPPHFIAYLKLLIDFTAMESSLPQKQISKLTSNLGMDDFFIAVAELYEVGERFVDKEHVRLMFDVLRLTLPHEVYRSSIGKPFARHCIEIAFPQEIHKIVRLLFSFAEDDQLNMDFSDILIYDDSVMKQINSDQAKHLIDVVSSFNNLPDMMLVGSIRYIEALVLKTQLKDYLVSYQVTEGAMGDLMRFYSQTLEQTDHSNLSSEAFMVIVKSLKNMMVELPMLSNMMWSMYCDVLYPRAKELGAEYLQALSTIMQTLNWGHSTFHIWNMELIDHMIEKTYVDPFAIGAMVRTFDWSWFYHQYTNSLPNRGSKFVCKVIFLCMCLKQAIPPTHDRQPLIPPQLNTYLFESQDPYSGNNEMISNYFSPNDFKEIFVNVSEITARCICASDPSAVLEEICLWLYQVASNLNSVPIAEHVAKEILRIMFIVIHPVDQPQNVFFLPAKRLISIWKSMLHPLANSFQSQYLVTCFFHVLSNIENGVSALLTQSSIAFANHTTRCPFEGEYKNNVLIEKFKGLALQICSNADERFCIQSISMVPSFIGSISSKIHVQVMESLLISYLKTANAEYVRTQAGRLLHFNSMDIHNQTMVSLLEACCENHCPVYLTILLYKGLANYFTQNRSNGDRLNTYAFALHYAVEKYLPHESNNFHVLYLYLYILELFESMDMLDEQILKYLQFYKEILQWIGTRFKKNNLPSLFSTKFQMLDESRYKSIEFSTHMSMAAKAMEVYLERIELAIGSKGSSSSSFEDFELIDHPSQFLSSSTSSYPSSNNYPEPPSAYPEVQPYSSDSSFYPTAPSAPSAPNTFQSTHENNTDNHNLIRPSPLSASFSSKSLKALMSLKNHKTLSTFDKFFEEADSLNSSECSLSTLRHCLHHAFPLSGYLFRP